MLNLRYKFFDRPIGKASSETRLYFAAPKKSLLDISSDLLNTKGACNSEGSFNARASYLSGQDIYGDAVLASIGYTWRSKNLFYEDVSLQSYHRFFSDFCCTVHILKTFFFFYLAFVPMEKMLHNQTLFPTFICILLDPLYVR